MCVRGSAPWRILSVFVIAVRARLLFKAPVPLLLLLLLLNEIKPVLWDCQKHPPGPTYLVYTFKSIINYPRTRENDFFLSCFVLTLFSRAHGRLNGGGFAVFLLLVLFPTATNKLVV